MAFEAPQSSDEYPPAAFRAKYGMFLAPYGELLSPQEVLQNRMLGSAAKENLKKAFDITIGKLVRRRERCAECGEKPDKPVVCEGCHVAHYCNDRCRSARADTHALVCHELLQESYDQLLECLPAPLNFGQEILEGYGGFVADWTDWFENHTTLSGDVEYGIERISLWWDYMGSKDPVTNNRYYGSPALNVHAYNTIKYKLRQLHHYQRSNVLEACLKRSASNVFSTVLTIAQSVYWLRQPELFQNSGPGLTSSQLPQLEKDIYIHLIGADKPEVHLVESGLVQLCARVLQWNRVHLMLVAPDLEQHPLAMALSPTEPLQMGPDTTIGCYPGLYHNFWEDHINTKEASNKVSEPTVAVAIHPGCHTSEMWQLWRPTFELLKEKRVPVLLTTYNQHEHDATLKVLQELRPTVLFEGKNPLASLLVKQTPYEPDHVWASNAFAAGISFS